MLLAIFARLLLLLVPSLAWFGIAVALALLRAWTRLPLASPLLGLRPLLGLPLLHQVLLLPRQGVGVQC